jgi:hypothetical protein
MKPYVVVLVKTVEADSPEEAKEKWDRGEGAGIGTILDPKDRAEIATIVRIADDFWGLAVPASMVMDCQAAEDFGMRATPTPPPQHIAGFAMHRRRPSRGH